MRIVSLNAWGGAMFDALRTWLPSCAADVICLQEVTRTAGLHGWTKYADGERSLPQRANLFADVADLLPGHDGRFRVSDSGPVSDANGRRWNQDFGIATFVHARVRMVGGESTFVHGSYVEHADWAVRNRPRVADAVRLAPPGPGPGFAVVQLHGLRDPGGKGDTPARLLQAERIADLVSRVRQAGDVAVVCGDLNVLPNSQTFDVLAEVGLTDLVGDADTRTSRYRKPVRHASYMLVSKPSMVRRFEVVATPEVSDHRALVLEM